MAPQSKNDLAVVLLSGGLDSATVLSIAREENKELIALSFWYGQRHAVELECSQRLARGADVRHLIVKLDPALFRGSALVGEAIDIPVDRNIDASIPVTYVPARNILFLSHALALAESSGASRIYIGVNALDYSGYPDCRPEFLQAFEKAALLGMKQGVEGNPVRFHAPLVKLSKAEIILRGTELGVDYGNTSSCYQPADDGAPCGRCDSCALRAKGFAEAGIADPLVQKFTDR